MKDTLTFIETLQLLVAIICCLVMLAFVMTVLAAGLYVGWHGFGPWFLRYLQR